MDDYFKVREYRARNAKKVLFFFPAGFTKLWQYKLTINFLNRRGITVIGFDFNWKPAIRDFNIERLHRLLVNVDNEIGTSIRDHPTIKEFAVLGLSFGTVPALYSAKRHEAIKSLVLFVPYGTLSHVLWTYKPAKPLLETLARDGITTEDMLEEVTKPIETQYQLEKLKGKRLVSFLGRNDKIVFDGESFVSAIQKQPIDATFYESRFGHFGTCLTKLFETSKWFGKI